MYCPLQIFKILGIKICNSLTYSTLFQSSVDYFDVIDVMEYTVCRSTIHQGFVSPPSVEEHLSMAMSVPLIPSTAYPAV